MRNPKNLQVSNPYVSSTPSSSVPDPTNPTTPTTPSAGRAYTMAVSALGLFSSNREVSDSVLLIDHLPKRAIRLVVGTVFSDSVEINLEVRVRIVDKKTGESHYSEWLPVYLDGGSGGPGTGAVVRYYYLDWLLDFFEEGSFVDSYLVLEGRVLSPGGIDYGFNVVSGKIVAPSVHGATADASITLIGDMDTGFGFLA